MLLRSIWPQVSQIQNTYYSVERKAPPNIQTHPNFEWTSFLDARQCLTILLKTVRVSLKLQRLSSRPGTNGVPKRKVSGCISKLWASWLAEADDLTEGMIFKISDTDQSGQTATQPQWSLILTCYLSSPLKYQTRPVDRADLKRETNTRLCQSKRKLLWMGEWGVSPSLIQPVPRRRHWWKEGGKEVEADIRGGREGQWWSGGGESEGEEMTRGAQEGMWTWNSRLGTSKKSEVQGKGRLRTQPSRGGKRVMMKCKVEREVLSSDKKW